MSILDQTRLENVQFMENHIPLWKLAPPPSIGLTLVQCTDLEAKTVAARGYYTAMLAARDAAKTATQKFTDSYNTMMTAGRADIGLIKAFAASQANPNTVYTTAQIPVPLPPGPGPVPTQPANFTVGLNPDGSVKLTWKAVGDGNTFWMVKRQLPGETEPRFIGGSGAKSFTDLTIPAGTSSMEYTVFGQRGDTSGPESQTLAVHFGRPGGDGLTFETVAPASGKVAA